MKSGNPASAAPVSTRTRRGAAAAAGRAAEGQGGAPTQDTRGLSNLAQNSVAPGHSQAGTKGAAGRKQRPNVSSRQTTTSARTHTQAVSQKVQAPDTMEVDGHMAGTPQYKLKEKRKRTQSESADAPALPNQEDSTASPQSMQQPSKKKKAKTNASVSQDRTSVPSKTNAAMSLEAPKSQLPPKVQRKGALPKIDVNKPDTPQPKPQGADMASGPTYRSSGPQGGHLDREDRVNEDGEDIDPDAMDGSESQDDNDHDQPESHDEGDLSNLANEAVSFARAVAGSPVAQELPASPAALHASATVTMQTPSTHKATQRERKLAEELPIIFAGKPLGQKSSTTASDTSLEDPDTIDVDHSDSEDTDESCLWLEHTDISSALKRSSKNKLEVQIKMCPPAVQEVLHTSFERGMVLLALGDGTVYPHIEAVQSLLTPFGLRGMEHISLEALITAAETHGYDGKYDIAGRLETGSQKEYIHPLRNYTAHRLRLYRGHIKKAATNAYPSAVQLSKLSRDESSKLLEGSNFLYPKLPNGNFQYAQPFLGAGITDVVKAAFFGNTVPYKVGTQNLSTLKSSLLAAPHELEIPDTMLAMAAAAIHSVLIDHVHPPVASKSGATEFAGTVLENAFKAYMTILVNMRITALPTYHALMHDIGMTVTGGNAISIHGNAALNDILANVDWANIAGA